MHISLADKACAPPPALLILQTPHKSFVQQQKLNHFPVEWKIPGEILDEIPGAIPDAQSHNLLTEGTGKWFSIHPNTGSTYLPVMMQITSH